MEITSELSEEIKSERIKEKEREESNDEYFKYVGVSGRLLKESQKDEKRRNEGGICQSIERYSSVRLISSFVYAGQL
jgi:hypothetical protein